MIEAVLWIIIASLLSGLIGVLLSLWHYRKYEIRQRKFDTLRRLSGNRYALDPTLVRENEAARPREDFLTALNETFIVFHDAAPVQDALLKYHETMSSEELVTLLKAMCMDLKVPYDFNDSFLLKAFCISSPNQGNNR